MIDVQCTQNVDLIKADEDPIAPSRARYPTVRLPEMFTDPPHLEAAPTAAAASEKASSIGDKINMGPTSTSSTVP